METSVKAAEVLVAPPPDGVSALDPDSSEGEAAASSSSSDTFDPMVEFRRRLDDIISAHGSAVGVLDKQQSAVEPEVEKVKEAKGDLTAAVDTDVSLIKQSLNNLPSPEEKLEDLVRKYAELASLRRSDEQRLNALQQKLSTLQAERRSSVAARSKLETLCRELHAHYNTVREETLQRCREDEEKRKEITTQFQEMLTEIQAQIEQHSARNNKLRNENTNLTDKLESLMNQCERREESLEKINKHHDLQLKLTEAKLQQANALLHDAEEKHKREKEYLLREAIDKTKKCFAMKEQELTMKKKLALYAEKFDEFQATLGKSNEIYVRFKKEMENMSDKMKKVEKEADLWKSRFENCNKALNDMMEERTEKSKEYELFVLKIHKLETLCHALQEERKVLYAKIKDVSHSNTNLPSHLSTPVDKPEDADKSALLAPEEKQQLQEEDPVLTEDMVRLRQQQAKLQQFADSLFNAPDDSDKREEKEELDLEEDLVSSAFVQFKTKPQHKEKPVSVPVQVEDVKPAAAESDLPQSPKSEEVQNPAVPTPDAAQTEVREVEQARADKEIQQPAAPAREPERTDPEPEASKVQILEETDKLKPLLTVQEEKATEPAEPAEVPAAPAQVPAEPAQVPAEPTQLPAAPAQVPAEPTQIPAEPAQVPAEPAQVPEEPAQVPEEPAEPAQVPAEPAQLPEEPAEPAQVPAEPAEVPEKPAEVPAEPAQVPEEPAEPAQVPAEPAPPSEDTSKPSASSVGNSSKKQTPKKKKKRSGKSAS